MQQEMRFIPKRISCFFLYSADGRQDLLGKGDHQAAEQAQEALGSLAGVMALDRHTDLDDAPAKDNNADGSVPVAKAVVVRNAAQSVRTIHTDRKCFARLVSKISGA